MSHHGSAVIGQNIKSWEALDKHQKNASRLPHLSSLLQRGVSLGACRERRNFQNTGMCFRRTREHAAKVLHVEAGLTL